MDSPDAAFPTRGSPEREGRVPSVVIPSLPILCPLSPITFSGGFRTRTKQKCRKNNWLEVTRADIQ